MSGLLSDWRRIGLALCVFAGAQAPVGAHGDDPAPSTRSLPAMDQAAQDWLNAPGSAEFGKWLVTVLEQYPDHPEWLAMYADILQGSRLGPTDGWFRKAVAQSRYGWQPLKERYDRDGDGKISSSEFNGSSEDFRTLDRDHDGGITENDLSWSEHALAATPGSMLYMEADIDSDGRVTKQEFDELFARMDQEGRGFVSQDELRALLSPPPAPPPSANTQRPRSSGPSKATLVRGLFQQEIGSMKPGPAVGEAAPDFTLRSVDRATEYTLSTLVGDRPVVLVFGNITCGPFRGAAGNVQKVYERYKDRANFLMVYVREAHPADGWHMTFNDLFDVKLPQPKSYDERVGVAQTCQRKIGFDMPFLVDTIDDRVGGTYSGMPSRLYVIDRAGKVAYKSGRGPFGFKPAEMEQALIWTLAEQATSPVGAVGAADVDVAPAQEAKPADANAEPARPADAGCGNAPQDPAPQTAAARVPLLDNATAWSKLPVVREGISEPALPVWARALARSLPRATAAMLALDYRHRAQSPLDPVLRAKMRWIAARFNRCDYTHAYAEADLAREGLSATQIESLAAQDLDHLEGDEGHALRFARDLTVNGSEVSDEQVAHLIERFGPDKVVAMVQLLAFSNFQDRLFGTLGVKVEPGGPLPPIALAVDTKVTEFDIPERVAPAGVTGPAGPERVDDPEWAELDVKKVRALLDNQKARTSRIPVPKWEDVVKRLPPGSPPPAKPVQIQWSLVCMGYQPLLGAGWSACTRGFAQDARQDKVFEESLFWVVTRTIHCFY